MPRLTFEQWLVLNAITARVHDGVCIATDRLVSEETRLTPDEVRDMRRGLFAGGLIECWPLAHDEYVITLADKVDAL